MSSLSAEARKLLNEWARTPTELWPVKYKDFKDYCNTEKLDLLGKESMEFFAEFALVAVKKAREEAYNYWKIPIQNATRWESIRAIRDEKRYPSWLKEIFFRREKELEDRVRRETAKEIFKEIEGMFTEETSSKYIAPTFNIDKYSYDEIKNRFLSEGKK